MTPHETVTKSDIDHSAPWKVTYDSSRAGKELSLNHTFRWCGRNWQIPAIYLCGKGLVVDFAAEVDPEQIAHFRKKWNRTERLSREAQQQMDFEDPFIWDYEAQISVNGKPLSLEDGRGICYEPEDLLADGCENDPECAPFLAHYGLDPKKGWILNRFRFPWVTKRAPTLKTLTATLTRRRRWHPACPVDVPAVGDSTEVTSPITGKTHILKVTDLQQLTMDPTVFQDAAAEFPTCYTQLTYTLSPDLPGIDVSLSDRDPGDRPRSLSGDEGCCAGIVQESGDSAVIGGADGSIALRSAGNPHSACSALRFAPAESISWNIAFSEDPRQSIWLNLL